MNGVLRNYPVNNDPSYSVNFNGKEVLVSTTWGLDVRFDARRRVYVSVPKSLGDNLTGICGNCNGIEDDFQTKDGQDVSMKEKPERDRLIGESYVVSDDGNKPGKE